MLNKAIEIDFERPVDYGRPVDPGAISPIYIKPAPPVYIKPAPPQVNPVYIKPAPPQLRDPEDRFPVDPLPPSLPRPAQYSFVNKNTGQLVKNVRLQQVYQEQQGDQGRQQQQLQGLGVSYSNNNGVFVFNFARSEGAKPFLVMATGYKSRSFLVFPGVTRKIELVPANPQIVDPAIEIRKRAIYKAKVKAKARLRILKLTSI